MGIGYKATDRVDGRLAEDDSIDAHIVDRDATSVLFVILQLSLASGRPQFPAVRPRLENDPFPGLKRGDCCDDLHTDRRTG